MRRLIVVLVLLVVFFVFGYEYFFSGSPTGLVVVEPVKSVDVVENKVVKNNVPVRVSDVVVSEEVVDSGRPVLEKVSENSLALNSVWVYSTKDGSVLDIIPVGANPVDVELSPNGWFLYVLNSGSRSVSVVDVENVAVVKTVALADEPRAMSLSGDGKFLAVVLYSGKVVVFDTKDFKETSVVTVGKKPFGVVFSNEGKYLFVVTERTNTLEKLNPYASRSIGQAVVGDSPVAVDLSVKDKAFVVNSGSDSVSVIDVIDMSRDKKYDVLVGKNPVSVLLDSEDKFVFVANRGANSVSVFDAESYKPVGEVFVGEEPVGLVFNPFVDAGVSNSTGGVLYVANDGSNDVSVVDVVSLKEVARWRAGSHPYSMVLSSNGGFLFVVMKGK